MNAQALQQAIGYLFPLAISSTNYTLAVDGSGNAAIKLWDNTLGPEPTATQLMAALISGQLASAQIGQQSLILAAYKRARWGTPVSLTVGANIYSFPTDAETQLNVSHYIAANILQQSATTTYPLLDVNGAVQMLNYTQIVALAQAIQSTALAAFSRKSILFAQIAAATTVTAVQALVW